jgi:hypothetical protein
MNDWTISIPLPKITSHGDEGDEVLHDLAWLGHFQRRDDLLGIDHCGGSPMTIGLRARGIETCTA